jgi:glucokinase
MRDYWLGLDVGGTKCAVLLARVDHGIQIVDKIRFATHSEKGFEYAYNLLCETMEEILARNSLGFDRVNAIGVSCGGPLDSRSGVVLCPPNLPGWVNIPLRKMLSEKYGVPAHIQNDANACALVEWKLGAGRGTQNMIFLTMGTGMGGGVIAEGQLLRGHTDMGGEIGHLRLSEDGPVGFGKAGSFEGYTSGGGIGRQAVDLTRAMIAEGNPPAWTRDGCEESEISAKLMAGYARKGDADAIRFWNHIGRMLGKGLALLVDSFNPERIVIGGVFMRSGDLLWEAAKAEIEREALEGARSVCEVVPAALGEQIGDFGAIAAALYTEGSL